MTAKKLLFITTRLFWPTDSGRKLSLYYYCKGLHEQYGLDIYLYSFLEAGQERIDVDKKPDFIKKIYLAQPIPQKEKLKNLLKNTLLEREWPIQCSLYYSQDNAVAIGKICNDLRPDYIFTDMIRTAMYYDAIQQCNAVEVLDMDDLLSARYERQMHARYKSNITGQYASRLPKIINQLVGNQAVRNLILRLEKNLTAKAEIAYSKLYDHVIFVSDVETKAINRLLPGKAVTIPVGINAVAPEKLKGTPEKNLLSFVGNLSVAANVDSLRWIINDILPKIKHNVKLMVIGKCPDDVKKEYDGNTSVIFTGRVDDLIAYVRKSQIFLSPLLYGTGIKTKILEAMSMEVPVVTNDVGAEGIAAENGKEFWVENEDALIAERVDFLLEHENLASTVAKKGRTLVENKYEWSKIYMEFEKVL